MKARRGGRTFGPVNTFTDRNGKHSPAVCVLSVMSDGRDWSCNWNIEVINHAHQSERAKEQLYEIARTVKDSLDNIFNVQ